MCPKCSKNHFGNKKIFSKIKTHKLLNNFFNNCKFKNSKLTLAISFK